MKRALGLLLAIASTVALAALPSSGAITFANLQTEFGGSNPIGFTEYYRGAGLVPNSAPYLGVPTSGAISLTQFYSSPQAALPASSVTLVGTGNDPGLNNYAGIALDTSPGNIVIEAATSGGLSPSLWLLSGSPGDFQVNLVQSGGTTWPNIPTEDVPSTWLSLSSPRHWYLGAAEPILCVGGPCPNPWTFTGTLKIRRASDSVEVASMTVSMSSTYVP